MSDELYQKIIYENEPKAYQLRLVVNEFKGLYYLNIRKYFLSFEGDWIPSKEGVSMEASLYNIFHLFEGLAEILSKEESDQIIEKYFKDRLAKEI